MAPTSASREAATILRHVLEALPLPDRVAAYLRGYADGLDRYRRKRPGSR